MELDLWPVSADRAVTDSGVCSHTHTHILFCQFESFWPTLWLTLHVIWLRLWRLSMFSCTPTSWHSQLYFLLLLWGLRTENLHPLEAEHISLLSVGLRAAWAGGDYNCLYRWMCYHLVFGNGSLGWTRLLFLCVDSWLISPMSSPWCWAEDRCVGRR